jgi:hypothetical protein
MLRTEVPRIPWRPNPREIKLRQAGSPNVSTLGNLDFYWLTYGGFRKRKIEHAIL